MAKARPVTSVHVDIAELQDEFYSITGESADSLDKNIATWARNLVRCLGRRDPALSTYGAKLLAEVEEYRKWEIERKKPKSSADSQGIPGIPRIPSPDQSITGITGKKKDPPLPPEGDPWFAVPDFSEAWSAWIAGRKKKPTARALELSIRHLREMSSGNMGSALRILERSTANGWTGLFPLKSNNGHGPATGRGLSDRVLS